MRSIHTCDDQLGNRGYCGHLSPWRWHGHLQQDESNPAVLEGSLNGHSDDLFLVQPEGGGGGK